MHGPLNVKLFVSIRTDITVCTTPRYNSTALVGANTSFISLRAARRCWRALEHSEN